MKLLVFAHTPPPHHGQSFMVQKMLEGFGGDQRKPENRRPNPHGIQCYHVNARVSKHLEDIGEFRFGKFVLMLGYCLQAIWCRFRYDIPNLYYVPAPGKRSALYRDWLVMAICRPFFKRLILHWHASGLGKWLETVPQVRSRSITYDLAGNADLSIVLSKYGRPDAEKLYPLRLAVVANGIADACPCFAEMTLGVRKARLRGREKLLSGKTLTTAELAEGGRDPSVYKVLFLSHCCRDKGLFETIGGVMTLNERLLAKRSPIRVLLTVAGTFMNEKDKHEFEAILRKSNAEAHIRYVGFVSGAEKQQLFEDADVFCFPSYLESFGLVLAEAMGCGLPIVATRCGALPEVLPENYQCLVPVKDSDSVAAALETSMHLDVFETLRERFQHRFTMERHLAQLASALASVEQRSASAFQDWEYLPDDLGRKAPHLASG